MAFDEKFLRDRVAKQVDWSNRGIRTGSGRLFGHAIDTRLSAGGFDVIQDNGTGLLKKKGTKSGSTLKPIGSPHAMALAQLAKNPESRYGGMVNGKKRPASHEHWEQVIIFDWLYRFQPEYYDDFSSVPMGGLRNKKTAFDLIAEGAKSGYPDITGDIPLGIYHGLFIELKYGKGKPSENQVTALNRKTNRGYFCALCYGHEEAIEVIKEYLALAAGGVMLWNKNAVLWGESID
jgi:hypothetical protein